MTKAQIGVYGLGTMGSALALNMAEQGIRVAVCNREPDWIGDFLNDAGPLADRLAGHVTLVDFIGALELPRKVLFMIPSGAPLDAMLDLVAPILSPGDTVIDAGNADFNDTERRAARMARAGLGYVGLGVSGGEEGARNGPSMMLGGSVQSWESLRGMLEPVAAQFADVPCVAHIGPGGAGHFVKTVHNGIEYADMQMIAEVYGFLRDGSGLGAAQIGDIFDGWQRGPLESFLIETTARALRAIDAETGAPMVDVILDLAGQKGTGRWTVIEALKLGQSPSAIEAAVAARAWSSEKAARVAAAELLTGPDTGAELPGAAQLADALLAGRILAHAQGFSLMQAQAQARGWTLDLARVAEIWRAGCIIRSALLDDIALACREPLPAGHLELSPPIRARLAQAVPGLRAVVASATLAGIAVPSLGAALAWYDSFRQGRGTANLIQAQRDLFGNHGFFRTDRTEGGQHGDW